MFLTPTQLKCYKYGEWSWCFYDTRSLAYLCEIYMPPTLIHIIRHMTVATLLTENCPHIGTNTRQFRLNALWVLKTIYLLFGFTFVKLGY